MCQAREEIEQVWILGPAQLLAECVDEIGGYQLDEPLVAREHGRDNFRSTWHSQSEVEEEGIDMLKALLLILRVRLGIQKMNTIT